MSNAIHVKNPSTGKFEVFRKDDEDVPDWVMEALERKFGSEQLPASAGPEEADLQTSDPEEEDLVGTPPTTKKPAKSG